MPDYPLKKCYICGLEAHNESELEPFVKNKSRSYGRASTCTSCNRLRVSKWAEDNPDKIKKIREETIRFKGENMRLSTTPRIGVCSLCGRVRLEGERQFQIHHNLYIIDNPLESTTELCYSCHKKIHQKIRRDKLPYLRKCFTCGVEAHTEQELEQFTKHKAAPHGRANECNKCRLIRDRKRTNYPYQKKPPKTPEEKRAYARRWYREHNPLEPPSPTIYEKVEPLHNRNRNKIINHSG